MQALGQRAQSPQVVYAVVQEVSDQVMSCATTQDSLGGVGPETQSVMTFDPISAGVGTTLMTVRPGGDSQIAVGVCMAGFKYPGPTSGITTAAI